MLSAYQLPNLNLETNSTNKPWVIIGAGPVGSMLAAMFATLFPEQEIHVYDKYYAHIRGHGLDIHASTINEMISVLNGARNKTLDILDKESHANKKHYEDILKRIDKLIEYLKKEVSGQFIRTSKISESLQKYCKEMSPATVHFHLKSEILAEDLAVLTDDSLFPMNKNQEILKNADMVFGADGAHSGVRKLLFQETSDDLRKDVLSYLLEIKLDMNEKSNSSKVIDKINRSILPTLKSGKLHIWNQSMDGTATLHIFVDKEHYDCLHVPDENGNLKGTFANPYRRLIDLPYQLKAEIESIIVDVIDANQVVASTLKITTIPMHVYKAKQLIKMIGDKRIALVGDAAIGLVLARGVNNGFYSTSDYAASLYSEDLAKQFGQGQAPDFINYQVFWEEQHKKLDYLLNYIDAHYPVKDNDVRVIANRQIKILDEYEKQYGILLKINLNEINHIEYALLASKIQKDFYTEIGHYVSLDDTNPYLIIFDIFKNLSNKDYLLNHPISELHQCVDRLAVRANKMISEAKTEVKIMETVNKVYDTSFKVSSFISSSSISSLDDDSYLPLDDDKLIPVNEGLKDLRAVIAQYDLSTHPEHGTFILLIDRMFLAIERSAKKLSYESEIKSFCLKMNAAIKFLTQLPMKGTIATAIFEHHHHEIDESLIDDIIASANYTFNQARQVQHFGCEKLIRHAIAGIQNYPEARKNDLSVYERIVGTYNAVEAKYYFDLLTHDEDPTVKLVILYSLFKNQKLNYLIPIVYQHMLGPDLSKQPPTELDIFVLCEVLRKMIKQSAQTKSIQVFETFVNNIIQIVNNGKYPFAEIAQLKEMLNQLDSVRNLDADTMIRMTLNRPASSKKDSEDDEIYVSKTSSFFGSSSISDGSSFKMFSSAPLISPTCMMILKDANIDSLLKLSILYVLLTNNQDQSLQRSLTGTFGKMLKPDQVAEVVKNKLKLHMTKEQYTDLESALYKLKIGINNGSTLEKELQLLGELFSSHQYKYQSIAI